VRPGVVVKVARTPQGIVANRTEWSTSRAPDAQAYVLPVLDADPQMRWLFMPEATGAGGIDIGAGISEEHWDWAARNTNDPYNEHNWGWWRGRIVMLDYA